MPLKARMTKLEKLLVSDLSAMGLILLFTFTPNFRQPIPNCLNTLKEIHTHTHTRTNIHTYIRAQNRNIEKRKRDKPFIFALSCRCWKFVNFDSCIITKTNYEKDSLSCFYNKNNSKESTSGILRKFQKLYKILKKTPVFY